MERSSGAVGILVAPPSPAAVMGASRPHRRGQDALATAGKMPALLRCSEILFQVHAAVQTCYLIVAVEHQCRTLQKFSQAPLLGLAPSGMIHIRIHVRVEAVLVRSHLIPRVPRLAVGEANPHNRLGSLVP